MTVLLALCGLILGLLVGFTSIGAGIIGAPVLIVLFGVEPVTAVGSISMAAIGMRIAGTYRHLQNKNVSWQIALPFLLGALPTAILTANYAELINSYIPLQYIIGIIIIISLPLLIYRFFRKQPADHLLDISLAKRILTVPVGIVLGAIMGATGIVGAITLVTFLLLFNLPTPLMVGTTSIVGFIALLFASLAHGMAGHVDFGIFLTLFPGFVIGALIGAHYVNKVAPTILRVTILVILLVSALMIFL